MSSMVVSYSRRAEEHTVKTTIPGLGTFVVDNSGKTQEEKGGTAKQLLAAASLYCFCNMLGVALESRGAGYRDIRGTATLETGSNDKGQGRVTKISIAAQVTMSEEDEDIFRRCEKIARQGCLVTSSLHDGIAMEYAVTPDFYDA